MATDAGAEGKGSGGVTGSSGSALIASGSLVTVGAAGGAEAAAWAAAARDAAMPATASTITAPTDASTIGTRRVCARRGSSATRGCAFETTGELVFGDESRSGSRGADPSRTVSGGSFAGAAFGAAGEEGDGAFIFESGAGDGTEICSISSMASALAVSSAPATCCSHAATSSCGAMRSAPCSALASSLAVA